jgi:hypothetical protein
VGDVDESLAERLYQLGRRKAAVALFLGSGLSATVVPTVFGMLSIADRYAETYEPETPGLLAELRRIRAEYADDDLAVYRSYRAAFAAWVRRNEFDLVAQAAVLQAYSPRPDGLAGPHDWQLVEAAYGENLERNIDGWRIPEGIAALGSVLARPDMDIFHHRVFTTCFDPLLEIAIARAGGKARRITVTPELRRRIQVGQDGPDDTVMVHHLHGYWRAEDVAGRHQLLHDPQHLIDNGEQLAAHLAELIEVNTICVVGHSGWDGILAAAIRRIAAQGRHLTVLWAAQSVDDAAVAAPLRTDVGPQPKLVIFTGIDTDVLLPLLAGKLRVPIAPQRPPIRDLRHLDWEREFVSEVGAAPPSDALDLLRQLDHRFQWGRSWSAGPVRPELVFWPVRLRSRPSVINMVQALVAATLSAREIPVLVCLDDFNVDDVTASTERFRRDVGRWFDLVPGSRWPDIESLQFFIERDEESATDHHPRNLVRPTRPWDVAREVLGERNPSVLDVLMAAKVVPDLPEQQLIEQADKIVMALRSRSARHLITPFSLWSRLNDLLVDQQTPTSAILTLGGMEERRLWSLWRFAFDHGVSQLYNPTLLSLTNQSLMLRWSDQATLTQHLRNAMREPNWADDGHYVQWLAQNAFLMPIYLCGFEPPTFRGSPLDSWPAVRDALRADEDAIEILADHVSRLYLGSPVT